MRANFDLLGSEGASSESLEDNNNQRPKTNGRVHYYIPTATGEEPGQSEEPKPDFLRQVSKTISQSNGLKTLRRSRLIHCFYVIALPSYTIFGALVFKALDGDYDDQALKDYNIRCMDVRSTALNLTNPECTADPDCLASLRVAIQSLDSCFRDKSYVPHPTHSMSSFANSLIFATSVYTTIGYGNIAPDTFPCRLATCVYAVVGIPLFFAFLKDMGQLFSQFFVKGWRLAGRLKRRMARKWRRPRPTIRNLVEQSVLPAQISLNIRKVSNNFSGASKVREQRKVFLWAVVFFVIYLIACSWIFLAMEPSWDLWTSFYFLFTSVALVGFGDVFPNEPSIVLINFAFIVLGIVLFGMCYFILQEEIREKAFQASRRVRNSIFRRGTGYPKRLPRSSSFEHRRQKSRLRLPDINKAHSSDAVHHRSALRPPPGLRGTGYPKRLPRSSSFEHRRQKSRLRLPDINKAHSSDAVHHRSALRPPPGLRGTGYPKRLPRSSSFEHRRQKSRLRLPDINKAHSSDAVHHRSALRPPPGLRGTGYPKRLPRSSSFEHRRQKSRLRLPDINKAHSSDAVHHSFEHRRQKSRLRLPDINKAHSSDAVHHRSSPSSPALAPVLGRRASEPEQPRPVTEWSTVV